MVLEMTKNKYRMTVFATIGVLSALVLGILAEMHVAGKVYSSASPLNCSLYFKKEDLCASLTWLKKPTRVEAPTLKDKSEFALEFWRPDHSKSPDKTSDRHLAKPPGNVVVSLWMPAMGHGSLPPQITADQDHTGRYDVDDVLFSMGGDWEIWVSILADNQLIDKSKLSYRLE